MLDGANGGDGNVFGFVLGLCFVLCVQMAQSVHSGLSVCVCVFVYGIWLRTGRGEDFPSAVISNSDSTQRK